MYVENIWIECWLHISLVSFILRKLLHNCTSLQMLQHWSGDHVPLQSTGHLCVGR